MHRLPPQVLMMRSHGSNGALPSRAKSTWPGRVFGIPSYHVQKLFSEVVGVKYVSTQAASDMSLVHTERVAAGATCQDEACTDLAVKVRAGNMVNVRESLVQESWLCCTT